MTFALRVFLIAAVYGILARAALFLAAFRLTPRVAPPSA